MNETSVAHDSVQWCAPTQDPRTNPVVPYSMRLPCARRAVDVCACVGGSSFVHALARYGALSINHQQPITHLVTSPRE